MSINPRPNQIMMDRANRKTPALWRERHAAISILKGWKSLSPGLRATSYPGLARQTRPILKGLHQGGVLLIILLTGCRNLGPHTIPGDRSEYSNAIGESWKRQTLLNIVKLRYLDPPIFVDVGQIVASRSLSQNITAFGNAPAYNGGPPFGAVVGNYGLSAGGIYVDQPTVTYTPLTGNKFIKSLMTPLPPESVFFMIQSGWPADAVLFAAVSSVNGLKNQTATIQ